MILTEWKRKPAGDGSLLEKEAGLPPLSAALLSQRGISTKTEFDAFQGTHQLTDPFSLADMDKAVLRVQKAAEEGEQVLIFGDYDADGVCSAAILWDYLHNLGVQAAYYLPDRGGEGYGLNAQVVRSAAKKGISLVITVDNGISCIAEVALAATLGIDVVILDHHQGGEQLPAAAAVVDPHRPDFPGDESTKQLCGAGVALLFVAAMEGEAETAVEMYAHYAALATVGDMMPLQNDSRFLVQKGLETLHYTDHGGLSALIELCGLEKATLTAENLAFALVPRLNAAGRMGSATDALRLLLEEDREQAEPLAAKVCAQNTERRRIEEEITGQIFALCAADPSLVSGRIAFFAGENWHRGVIGIVAAKLMRFFGKPVFIADIGADGAVGSARSFGDFSVFDALTACAGLLDKFGGHKSAGGFSCPPEHVALFREALERHAAEHFPVMPLPEQNVDLALSPGQITLEAVTALSALEPCGNGNESPVFLIENLTLRHIYALSEGRFVRFDGVKDGKSISFVCFTTSFAAFPFAVSDKVDLLFTAAIRPYRGEDTLSCKCLDIRPAAFPYSAYHLGLALYERALRNEAVTESEARKALPTRDDFRTIWKLLCALPQEQRQPEVLFFRLFPVRIGYAKIRFALRIMEELGLTETDAEGIHPQKPNGKADFEHTRTYLYLSEKAGTKETAR